ncbi:MAG TPA: hypothetical protein VJ251_06320, partial [Stellaceae bacterium]|nr:hypothetical protein [Stellaceae bacterium]
AAVKARSLSSDGITPQRYTAGTAVTASDAALIENAAAAEAAATQLRSDVAESDGVAPASAAATSLDFSNYPTLGRARAPVSAVFVAAEHGCGRI